MDEWIHNPNLENMEPLKRELIQKAAKQVAGKSGKDMVPVMLALITSANKQGIRFTPEEMELILSALKEGKSEKEQAQIDQTIRMVTNLIRQNSTKH